MVSIRILRTIAEVDLCKLIDRGNKLVHDKSAGDFQSFHKSHVDWTEDVLSCLSNFFEGADELIAQWKALQVDRVDEGKSLREDINGLRDSAQRRTEWLRDLHDRLKDFPQSPTTPM